ncbi:MAG: dockerin type I repeat-containing protein, partial [candidate division WOR-3 bacterium]
MFSITLTVRNTGNIDLAHGQLELAMPPNLFQINQIVDADGGLVWDRDTFIMRFRANRDTYPERYQLDRPGVLDSILRRPAILYLPRLMRGQATRFRVNFLTIGLPTDGQFFEPTTATLIALDFVKAVGMSFAQHFIAQNLSMGSYLDELDPLMHAGRRSFWDALGDLSYNATYVIDKSFQATIQDYTTLGSDCANLYSWGGLAAGSFLGLVAGENRKPLMTTLYKSLKGIGLKPWAAFQGADQLTKRFSQAAGKMRVSSFLKLAPALDIASTVSGTYWEVKEKYDMADKEKLLKEKVKLKKKMTPQNSWDPNMKVGVTAGSVGDYVPADHLLSYTIFFENKDSATAEAESIWVTDRIDGNLDWSTLHLDSVSHPQVCTVTADSATRTITWLFGNINLPPNRRPPEGEGWCRFSIMPKANLPSGARIDNYATIIFDVNPPLNTDTIHHTIDAGIPSSQVRPLADTTRTAEFMVRWNGRDDSLGSGIVRYNVFARADTGPWIAWQSGTTDTMAEFFGANSTRYSFYSTAVDGVNHEESRPDSADVATYVTALAPPIPVSPPDTILLPAQYVVTRTPHFRWVPTAGSGGRHILQYSPDSTFTSRITTIDSLRGEVYGLPDSLALADSTWYWRIEAISRAGVHSGFRPPRRFAVDLTAPPAPELRLPANGALINDSLPLFAWTRAQTAEPVDYLLCYTADTLIDSLVAVGWPTADTFLALPSIGALNDTTHIWLVRARDRAGNLSQAQVPFRFTVATNRLLSGQVSYYAGALPPIEDAHLILTGGAGDTAGTNSAGRYEFSDLPSRRDYTVTPEFTNPARSSAVTAYDAALTLSHAARRRLLDEQEQIAANVSGDSTVSSYDAALILQYAVGRTSHFPAGHRPELDTVDWRFLPASRSYQPLRWNQGSQDYTGVMYGDPSGNWPGLALPGSDDAGLASKAASYFEVNMPAVESPDDQTPMIDQALSTSSQSPLRSRVAADITAGSDGQSAVGSEWLAAPGELSSDIVYPIRIEDGHDGVVEGGLLFVGQEGRVEGPGDGSDLGAGLGQVLAVGADGL